MGGVFSKNISTWADKILDEHCEIITHGNSPKTHIVVLSTDPDKDKLVENDLKKDPKTNKVTYHVLPLRDYCTLKLKRNFLPSIDCCKFKDANKKREFIEKIKHNLKPTVILISPKHHQVTNALKQNVLLHKVLIASEQYNIWSTLNMTIKEPVILTFTVPATTNQVGKILKRKLKESKKTIPNDANTRVLWIDGGHGGQRTNAQGEYEAVGGKSGLSDETLLNWRFYKAACADVGIQPDAAQFRYKPSDTRGDFVQWNSSSFPRPDICLDPVTASPLPPDSILNDPELNKMKMKIVNIADFHNTPDLRGDDPDTVRKRRKELLAAVKRYDPTVIFIGWCYSSNGDVALALRGSPVLSLMLLKDDLRNISGVATAELDPEQIEIILRLSEGDIRHCVFSGSSGTGKSYMCAEFGKILAAKLINDISGIQLEIVVCSLFAGNVEKDLLYQVYREKYFPGVEGFNVTYLSVEDMCERFGVDDDEYIDYDNDKSDIVGLITAVCEKCDSENCAKNDGSRTIFLLDEAMMYSKDGVCDYSPLADLCRLKTVYTATCINPKQFGDGGEFTVKLPVACPVPCDKGHTHGCTYSAQLLNCYRNTAEIRQVLQFWSDHTGGLLSHKSDKLGANLPPRVAGQHSAVTWVQCHSQENMEKAARDTLHMLDNNNEKDVQILYSDRDVVASAVVTNVKHNYKAVHFIQFYGCEADHIVYVCNKVIQTEVLSRPRRGLIVITGPDLLPVSQSLMKALAGDHHSETSRGRVACRNKPCPWSCGHVSPVAHHVSLVAHTVSPTCGWTPLVEHKVVCGACRRIMERTRDNCQCGEKYLESRVAARAAARSTLKLVLETVKKTTVTDEEVDDLLGNDDIASVTHQLATAFANNEEDQLLPLLTQLIGLINTHSTGGGGPAQGADEAANGGAARSTLKLVLETVRETTVTDEELDNLLANDDIVNVTQQLDTAMTNDEENQQLALLTQLDGLVNTHSTGGGGPAQGAAEARKQLKELDEAKKFDEAKKEDEAKKRLLNEFKQIQSDPPKGAICSPEVDNIMVWNAVIFGPDHTVFQDGIFQLTLEFNGQYPYKPPVVKFLSQMFHPNIDGDTGMMKAILMDNWSPAHGVVDILKTLRVLLEDPNLSGVYVANAEAAKLFRENRREYKKKVQESVEKSWST